MDFRAKLHLAAFIEGSEAAFAELVQDLTPGLRKLARRLTAAESKNESDELLWATFERMFEKANQYNEERGSVETWAKQIMTNIWYDTHAHRARRPLMLVGRVDDDLVAPPSGAGLHSDEAEAAVWRLDIQRALVRLDNIKRALVLLVDYEGHSVVDAAVIVGLGESNARHHLQAARGQLRRALGLEPRQIGEQERTVSE